jgi:dipeptidyl-peptidase-4
MLNMHRFTGSASLLQAPRRADAAGLHRPQIGLRIVPKNRAIPVLFLLLAGLALALFFAPASAHAQQTDLTVERIYGAPSLSGQILRDTVWSPDGKSLTYLGAGANAGDENGGPAMWAVDAATGRRSVLIDAAHLRSVLLPAASRGQQTGLGRITPPRYIWSPDSQAILFISAKELFWYELAGKTSRQLLAAPPNAARRPGSPDEDATIDDVKISPDGRSVSFLRNHDLWIVSVAGGAPRQLTTGGTEDRRNAELDWVYPEELDLHTAYWWSPDSSKIAFLQLDERAVEKYPLPDSLSFQGGLTVERYPVAGSANPVARVGVVSVGAAAAAGSASSSSTPSIASDPVWIDTGSDPSVLLARVDWLADSKRVAIERLNRLQNHLDLLFAAADTGKSQVALAEQDKYWININDDLKFLADGKRFLWSSERTGFRHLYLYDLEGKQLAQLTHGDWEVNNVAGVDEKKGQIYFTSTKQSAIERHFYRVAIPAAGPNIGTSAGEPVQLTTGHGTHEANLAPDFAHFLDTYSNVAQPPRQTLFRADATSVATLEENKVAELASYRLAPAEFFTVPGADGTPLDAMLIKPPNFDPARKYPVVVHLYGGPGAQEVRDAWQGSTYLWHQLMAEKGFVVFVLDNRGTTGRGHAFETPIYHHFGQAELADQLAGVNWLTRQAYVDRARIGIWGWSYGGYMTCVAMLRAPDIFKAGFAGAPVTDWRQYDTIYTERYMGTLQENPDGYRDSSPVNFAAALQGKLLIVHATGDDNVHFANTVELAEKFVDAEKYAEYQIYAGRGHGISDAPARIHIFNRVTQFFIENLAK